MAKILTDNLLKPITSRLTVNGGNTVSEEVDLELPRGYVAKIREIRFMVLDWHEDFEEVAAEINFGIHMALLRDPDDITTDEFPNNEVQHDVIDDFKWSGFLDLDTAVARAMFTSESSQNRKYDEDMDVITARNMRFNITGNGADAASLTETQCEVTIWYTLEKVTDDVMLDLLDIL